MKKVLLNLPDELVDAIDAKASNRTQFIRNAIEAFIGSPLSSFYEDEKSRKEREFDEFLGVAEWQEYLRNRDKGGVK